MAFHRIVKPYDWQHVRSLPLEVIVEGVETAGYAAMLYTYDDYFQRPAEARVCQATAPVEVLPGRIGRATLSDVTIRGRCVLVIFGPAGRTVADSGVCLSISPTTTWVPGGWPGEDAARMRYPIPHVSSTMSYTPGHAHVELGIAPDLRSLCDGRSMTDLGARACSLSVSRAFNGMDSLSLEASVGAEDPVFAEMTAGAHWTSNVPYVARFRDVVAHVPSGMVMLEQGLWSDSVVTGFFNDPELRQYPELFRANDEVGYLGHSKSADDLLGENGIGHWPGIPMLLSNVGYRNHAHWVLNSLLAAYFCREMIISGRICVLIPEYSDYMVKSLLALGIRRHSIVVASKGFYRLPDVLFPSTLSTHVNRALPPEVGPMFDLLRAHCVGRTGLTGPKRVYLTRQGSGNQRKISNEDALIAELTVRGFACIAPHELTFEEEVSCVANADVIVGQLGAAMVNIAFAPHDAWIVELASHNYPAHDYWILATTLGQKYARVLVRTPIADALTLSDFAFEVPLGPTLAAIDKACTLAAATAA